MSDSNIRWKQRLSNFKKAFSQLKRFIEKEELNELEVQGLIQSFEYNYELSWNVIKDYLEFQGIENIIGSRDAFRFAFQRGLIEEGELWMEMIKSRQRSSHTYDEEIASEIAWKVKDSYFLLFEKLIKKLEQIEIENNT